MGAVSDKAEAGRASKAKSTTCRTLSYRTKPSTPEIWVQAYLTDDEWSAIRRMRCTQVGPNWYLNGLVKRDGLLTTNHIQAKAVFKAFMEFSGSKKWMMFSREFDQFHWGRSHVR